MRGRVENRPEAGPLGGDNEITRGFGFNHLMLSHKRIAVCKISRN